MAAELPEERKRFISPDCAFCIGTGLFLLTYLQFVLLAGISVGIISFARESTSFSYLALIIYAAIICAFRAPIIFSMYLLTSGMGKIGAKSEERDGDEDAGLLSKFMSGVFGSLLHVFVTSLGLVLIAILTYAAMQILHAKWWILLAVLGVARHIIFDLLPKGGKPLEDPMLVERFTGLIERGNVNMRLENVRCMDGIPNATGILRPGVIMMGGSMLKELSVPEAEAVFAHELGHVKVRSVGKKFLVIAALTFVRLYTANLIYGILLPVYGFSDPEQIAAFPLLAFCWLILGLPVIAIRSRVSRYFERKADRFAISQVGEPIFSSAFGKILEQEQTISPIMHRVCHSRPCRGKRLYML